MPEATIEELDKAQDKTKKGIEIAVRLINEMKGMCQGIHIMAIGLEAKVPVLIDAAGL
jgi:5,10-methylenetetrahydrofolate reductase